MLVCCSDKVLIWNWNWIDISWLYFSTDLFASVPIFSPEPLWNLYALFNHHSVSLHWWMSVQAETILVQTHVNLSYSYLCYKFLQRSTVNFNAAFTFHYGCMIYDIVHLPEAPPWQCRFLKLSIFEKWDMKN